MRPTKEANDLEFWLKSRQYWKEKAEFYSLTKDSKLNENGKYTTCQWAEAQETRCLANVFKAEMNFLEAQGLIEVYSGRKKAFKTVNVAQAFKPMTYVGKKAAFTL